MRTGFWESLPPLVVVTGKGGVGKTMVSCALARAAVKAGLRVLLLELDARESLHRFLGCSPSGGGVIDVAPDRLLWGTDWPHGNNFEPRRIPDDGDLIDLLALMAPDEALRRKIFVDNPARLFGWDDGAG